MVPPEAGPAESRTDVSDPLQIGFGVTPTPNVGERGYTTISERVKLVTSEAELVCRTRLAISTDGEPAWAVTGGPLPEFFCVQTGAAQAEGIDDDSYGFLRISLMPAPAPSRANREQRCAGWVIR